MLDGATILEHFTLKNNTGIVASEPSLIDLDGAETESIVH